MSESAPVSMSLENGRFARLIVHIRPTLAHMPATLQKPAFRYTATAVYLAPLVLFSLLLTGGIVSSTLGVYNL